MTGSEESHIEGIVCLVKVAFPELVENIEAEAVLFHIVFEEMSYLLLREHIEASPNRGMGGEHIAATRSLWPRVPAIWRMCCWDQHVLEFSTCSLPALSLVKSQQRRLFSTTKHIRSQLSGSQLAPAWRPTPGPGGAPQLPSGT